VRDLLLPAGSVEDGVDPVAITPERAGWGFAGLHVMRLAAGEQRSVTLESEEAAVLPLSGSCRVEVGSRTLGIEGRANVFSRVSDFVYLPVGSEARVTADGPVELALPTARADRRLDPVHVPAEAVAVEVLTPDGNWSSFPPHKHDEHTDREVPLEEIYYFRIHGEGGFGIHRTYTPDREIDVTATVRDGDAFLIPRGYHGPCIAAPGHTMYYLNVMAGPAERAWRVCMDPAHEWLVDVLAAAGPDPRCPLTTAAGPR
jgi:5-deoxy-glucuronate isomerase